MTLIGLRRSMSRNRRSISCG